MNTFRKIALTVLLAGGTLGIGGTAVRAARHKEPTSVYRIFPIPAGKQVEFTFANPEGQIPGHFHGHLGLPRRLGPHPQCSR